MEKIKDNQGYTGKGIFTYPNRNEYIGDFVNGLPDGMGKMIFCNYDTYEGEWKAGQMNGQGTYRFYDLVRERFESIYKGSFSHNAFHGEGKMTYSDRSVYYGLWTDGLRNGIGQLLLVDGTLLSGVWQNDHLTEGVAILPNGQRYSGNLGSDYRFDGWGTLFSPDGSWMQGEWSKGSFINGNVFSTDGICRVFADGKQITVQNGKQ